MAGLSCFRKVFPHLWSDVNLSQVISRNVDAPFHFSFVFRGLRNQKQFQRLKLSPIEEFSGVEKRISDLARPFGFTLLITGCSFTGAAIWQYESMRSIAHKAMAPIPSESNHAEFFNKAGSSRQTVNLWWNKQSPGQKVVAFIIGLNIGVFMMWKIVPLQKFMLKYFAASPMSEAPCWSMLLSTFSHFSLIHLVCNMYVLWSFAPVATQLFGKEQFVAAYISAGMVSSFTSYFIKIVRKSRIPSVGASGAIMGLLGAVCITYPHAGLSIAFVDQIFPHSFSAGTAMVCLLLFDIAGVAFRWKLFDHAAHLGGMIFGVWYVKYGNKLIWHHREPIVRRWHDMHGK